MAGSYSHRLQLNDLIHSDTAQDNTAMIRELKHSSMIREEVARLVELRDAHANDSGMTDQEKMTFFAAECNFLFVFYTDIFNKVRKDELDMRLLGQFLDVLSDIEQEKCDQHEGSVRVGTILKQIYVDSALRKADKLNTLHTVDDASGSGPAATADLTYLAFKQMQRVAQQAQPARSAETTTTEVVGGVEKTQVCSRKEETRAADGRKRRGGKKHREDKRRQSQTGK